MKWIAGVALLAGCSGETGQDDTSTSVQAATASGESARISAWAAARNAPDGDIVDRVVTASNTFDCVPWELQPSVKGSKLRRADVVPPPDDPPELAAQVTTTQAASAVAAGPAHSEYEDSSHQCPAGSVPIRRFTAKDLSKFSTLDQVRANFETTPHVIQCSLSNPQRYYENYYTELSVAKPGMHAQIWVDPATTVGSGTSFSQVWLAVNHHPCTSMTSSVETLESGWVRRPGGVVELFVFYTPNGYTSSCFNLSCSGMTAFTYLSGPVPGGGLTKGYLDMAWHLYLPGNSFGVSPGWWFYANGWVGYYPLSIYDAGLQSGATLLGAGGEITPTHGTQMGNGLYGNNTSASYVSGYMYLETDHTYRGMPNAYYYGDGRYDFQSGSNYFVDGRQTFGWPVTGTYSIPIDSALSFFRFGGPGP